MLEEPRPYLVDAAKQLESAARRLRRIGLGGEYTPVAIRMMREAISLIDAAEARIRGAADEMVARTRP
jgi:hypothetical protein